MKNFYFALFFTVITSPTLAQTYDLSKLRCHHTDVLRDFAAAINSSSTIKNLNIQLVDVQNPRTISKSMNSLQCFGFAIFSSGEEIRLNFELTISNLGAPLWRWEIAKKAN